MESLEQEADSGTDGYVEAGGGVEQLSKANIDTLAGVAADAGMVPVEVAVEPEGAQGPPAAVPQSPSESADPAGFALSSPCGVRMARQLRRGRLGPLPPDHRRRLRTRCSRTNFGSPSGAESGAVWRCTEGHRRAGSARATAFRLQKRSSRLCGGKRNDPNVIAGRRCLSGGCVTLGRARLVAKPSACEPYELPDDLVVTNCHHRRGGRSTVE